jgi:hypothetical protein
MDYILLAFFVFFAYPVITIITMWTFRWHGILGAALAAIVVLLFALLLSFADAEAADCDRYFTVAHAEQDPDGNTWFSIRVTEFASENPTDGVCKSFGECVLALIESSPGMGSVEIVNPADQFVPSQWRVIDIHKAMLLADRDPYEEWASLWSEVDYDD